MEPGFMLRIIMIGAGCLILVAAIFSLARKHMTEPFSLAWGGFSVLIICAGFLLRPADWNRYISSTGLIIFCLLGFIVIYGFFFISCRVSER